MASLVEVPNVARKDGGAGSLVFPSPMHEFTVQPLRPYSLEHTAERLGRFDDGIDRFDGKVFRRLIFHRSEALLVEVSQQGGAERAQLRVKLEGRALRHSDAQDAAGELVGRMLGSAQPVRGFYRDLATDSVLAPAIRDFRGLRVAGAASLFEAIITAILAQQVNLAFAYSIRGELALRFGRRARIAGRRWLAFPTPRRLAAETPEALRALRLSGAKARAIHGVAEAFRSGALREATLAGQGDEAATEALVALRGVGRWTAEISLLRGLGRPDVFPAADLAVVKYLAQELLGHEKPASEARMREWAERWRPWRSLALVYAYAEMLRRRA